jgi:ketol-acid reductoisomerase
MATFFYEADANLDELRNLPIGLIGYGNQGRAHAMNLRDSGLTVKVGSSPDGKARTRATADGFAAHSIAEVADNCNVLAIMLPDEVIPTVYVEQIEPYLKSGMTLLFAHGFVVRHKLLRFPEFADILLCAPTGPGRQVRSLYEEGKGLPALIAVEQDASGLGWQRVLAYAHGIGCTRAGVIKTTFEEETVTDLYCEQAVLCGGMPELIKSAFETLVERGYQKELAYISCLKEVKLIADLLFTQGVDGMRAAISTTAKYGSAVAGPKLVNEHTKHQLEEVLTNIESGAFGKSFIEDTKNGSRTIKDLMAEEKHSRIARTGRELADHLVF